MLVSYAPGQLEELTVLPNRPPEQLFENVKSCVARGLPVVDALPANDVPAVLVGGGYSINGEIDRIRAMKAMGAKVFAFNNTAQFLHKKGITPDYQVMIDSREANVDFVDFRWADKALLCSQCHPVVFDKCQEIGYPVEVWHPVIDGIEPYVGKNDPLLIGGGLTVGLSGMCLAYTLGYRQLHLFGYDSCHRDGKSHAYEQRLNEKDELTSVAVDGRVFTCSVAMAAQAFSFQKVAEMLADHDCLIFTYGDGLIQHIANAMTREVKPLKAVYDLGLSPPTYDFLGFLVEAEKARIEGGFTCVDVYFQPGPIGGFRQDNLPPDVETRAGMFHRICVSACRLLPSVRNVHILRDREKVEGDVFPKGYTVEHGISHYGTRYLKNIRPLTATAGAKRFVSERFRNYVTITLRQSDYWPSRNSNLSAWRAAAELLNGEGITPVFVPDTEGFDVDGFENFRDASVDIDLRLALYEGAIMNFGVSNGPMALCYLSNAPYTVFKMLDEKTPATTKAFLEAHGLKEGESFSDNGTLVWKDDDKETVLEAVKHFLTT